MMGGISNMKYILFIIIGFITFWIVDILSINVGYALGAGPASVGVVVTAISTLSAIIVVCTCIIVDTLKNINLK